MLRARPVLAQRRLVLRRDVALVLGEVVVRAALVHLDHDPVAGHLRDDDAAAMQAATRSPFQTARPGTSSPGPGSRRSARRPAPRSAGPARGACPSTLQTCSPSRSTSLRRDDDRGPRQRAPDDLRVDRARAPRGSAAWSRRAPAPGRACPRAGPRRRRPAARRRRRGRPRRHRRPARARGGRARARSRRARRPAVRRRHAGSYGSPSDISGSVRQRERQRRARGDAAPSAAARRRSPAPAGCRARRRSRSGGTSTAPAACPSRSGGQTMTNARPITSSVGIVPWSPSLRWDRESADVVAVVAHDPQPALGHGDVEVLLGRLRARDRGTARSSGAPLTVTRPCASQQTTWSPPTPMTRLMKSLLARRGDPDAPSRCRARTFATGLLGGVRA